MVRESNKPLLIMFAGPNGSGKSTVTPIFQSQSNFPENYINPDEIALTLGGNTMSKAYEASAIAAKERLKCIEQKQSFSFETVMSHPSKLAILETAIEAGFETQLIFISTDNCQTNVERVKQRVVEGGHDVPENKVVSRYHRSLSLLPKASEIADKTYIFDNSDSSKLELILSQGKVIEKPGNTIEWVEKTIAILDERRQEKLAIEQCNPECSFARLDRDEHIGIIESIGKYFSVQQTRDGQTIVHENSILNLDNSVIGEDISISYHNGVHKVNSTREIQQARVEKIAPILIDYLKLNHKKKAENDNSVVKFDSETKIITYQNKVNPQEYLKAQYVEDKWLDIGSNISQTKESYFTDVAAVDIAQLQSKKPKPTNSNPPGDQSRKRRRNS